MDSRLRGNDINGIVAVIPAKAGMIVRTALTGTPPSVIPAKAGIHTAYPNTNAGGRASGAQRCIPHRYTVRSSTLRKMTFSTVIPMRITVNRPAKTWAVSRFWLFS